MLKYLSELLEYLEYYNRMAPFPVYDSEYVEKLRQKIKEMKLSKENYDELPVAACRYCKNLQVEVDELDNDICMRCGSINDLTIYKDIFEYLEEVKKSNEDDLD